VCSVLTPFLPSTVARAARLNVSFPEPGRCSGRPADHYVLTDLWRSPAATSERSIDHLMFGQMMTLLSTSAMVAAPAGPPVLDSRVQIKFRTARDLRLRLRVATATTERTQDEILAEALAEGSRSPTWRGVPQAGS